MEFNINKSYEQMAAEVANRVLDEYEFNGKTIRAWAETLTYPKTNADRIRAMTDEELAEWIGKVTAGGYGMCAPGHYDCTGKDSCAPCWLDWLRQEEDHVNPG